MNPDHETDVDQLQVGQKYYVCYADHAVSPAEPIVETLVYLGYEEMDITSNSCDKPYHFYKFTYFRHEYPQALVPSQLILVPSRRQLGRYANFFGFIQNLRKLLSRIEENEGFELPDQFGFLRLPLELDNKEVGNREPTPPKNE